MNDAGYAVTQAVDGELCRGVVRWRGWRRYVRMYVGTYLYKTDQRPDIHMCVCKAFLSYSNLVHNHPSGSLIWINHPSGSLIWVA